MTPFFRLLAVTLGALSPALAAEPLSRWAPAAEVCSAQGVDAATSTHAYTCVGLRQALLEERYQDLDALFAKCNPHSADVEIWNLLMHPDSRVTGPAYRAQLNVIAPEFVRELQRPKPSLSPLPIWNVKTRSLEDELRAFATSTPTYSPAQQAATQHVIDVLLADHTWDAQLNELKALAPQLCEVYRVPECEAALVELTELMHPRVGWSSNYSMLPVLKRFLSDPQFVPGAVRAALRVMERVRVSEAGGTAREGDLLTDLVESYRESGLSDADAESHAWDFLAIYSGRGASNGELGYLFHENNQHLGLAFLVIAAGTNHLDALRAPNWYSYPSTLRGDCYYGKSYHFWMTAYFARYTRERGYAESTAYVIPYLLGVGYEFDSHTMGRDPLKVFFNETFDIYNDGIRANLIFGLAGARYGSLPNVLWHRLDVDSALEKVRTHALEFPAMTEAELRTKLEDPVQRMMLWALRFRPNLAIPGM